MVKSTADTSDHSRLLRALIAHDDEARDAASAWIGSVDLDTVDADTSRVLPQVYLRLRTLGIEHAEMGRLRGIYRFHWYRNRLLLRALRPALARLAADDVPCALAGGLAIAGLHCGDVGARAVPMAELLLDESRVADAVAGFARAGWIRQDADRTLTPAYVATRASMVLRSPDDFALTVHWRTFDWDLGPRAVVDAARHSRPAEIEGVALRILDPTALLLLTCVADPTRPPRSPLWIADAAAIVRGGDIDWPRLVRHARSAGRGPNAARGLATLGAHALAVPQDGVDALRRGLDRDRLIAALSRGRGSPARWLYRAARMCRRARGATGGTLRFAMDIRRLRSA